MVDMTHYFSGTPRYLAAAERLGSKGIGAATGRILGSASKIALFGTMAPLGALAMLKLLEHSEKRSEKGSRDDDFQAVLDEAPDLTQDRAKALKHFMTLRRLAPDLSRDPPLAAGYIKKVKAYESEGGGVDPAIVKDLLIRKGPETLKKWEVATKTLPENKVSANLWEL